MDPQQAFEADLTSLGSAHLLTGLLVVSMAM